MKISQSLKLPLCLLVFFSYSSVGSLPRQKVTLKLLQCGAFPQPAVLQECMNPVWVPTAHQSCQNTCSTWLPCCRPQLLLQHGLPSGHIHLLQHGYLLHCDPPWAAGARLPHHGLYCELHVNLSSGAWSTFCPSFSTDLGV